MTPAEPSTRIRVLAEAPPVLAGEKLLPSTQTAIGSVAAFPARGRRRMRAALIPSVRKRAVFQGDCVVRMVDSLSFLVIIYHTIEDLRPGSIWHEKRRVFLLLLGSFRGLPFLGGEDQSGQAHVLVKGDGVLDGLLFVAGHDQGCGQGVPFCILGCLVGDGFDFLVLSQFESGYGELVEDVCGEGLPHLRVGYGQKAVGVFPVHKLDDGLGTFPDLFVVEAWGEGAFCATSDEGGEEDPQEEAQESLGFVVGGGAHGVSFRGGMVFSL